jgi:ADP-heptose:LPS heptosyltransferase
VLAGGGAADVSLVLPWESAAFAPLLLELGAPAGPAADRIRAHDAAVVFSRDRGLAATIARLVGRAASRDPAPPAAGPHASRWLAEALPPVGIPAGEIDVPPLLPSEAEGAPAAEIAAALPRRFVALHPGSGSASKNWPAARFAELARSLAPSRWLLVRGPADDDAASTLAGVPGAVVARDLPLRALAALLGRAGAYVGNDSGVTHLAAAAGAPTVALFGATDARVWAPPGPAVRVVDCGSAMDGASVETVRSAIADLRRGSR